MDKSISKNIITSFIYQCCQVLAGFIIPKLILSTFGSDVNGLINSITQFSNYVTLLEGGVTGVMTANLYKPLLDNDEKKISSIIVTIDSFYRKIAVIMIVYQIGLAIVYPILVADSFDRVYVSSLVIILGANLFVQYAFSLTYRVLLSADNKLYYINMVMAFTVVINTIVTYVGIIVYPDIHIVKSITGLVYFIQPIAYWVYVKKHYRIDKKEKKDSDALSQRWNGFGINIAAFIHANTDIVVLTLFCDVYAVSVYSLYNYVTVGGKLLIDIIVSSFVPMFGKKLATKDYAEINRYFDYYEFISLTVIFFVFTLISVLIVPFEMIYTSGITDTNYYQPLFGLIIVLSEMVFCIRTPYIHYAYQSGHFKEITKYAYVEAIINIIVSIVFVYNFGIVGVAIGTLVSMIYRLIKQVEYASIGMNRARVIFYKYVAVFGSIFMIINVVLRFIPIYSEYCIESFVLLTVITGVVELVLFTVVIRFFYNEYYLVLKNRIIHFKH